MRVDKCTDMNVHGHVPDKCHVLLQSSRRGLPPHTRHRRPQPERAHPGSAKAKCFSSRSHGERHFNESPSSVGFVEAVALYDAVYLFAYAATRLLSEGTAMDAGMYVYMYVDVNEDLCAHACEFPRVQTCVNTCALACAQTCVKAAYRDQQAYRYG